MKFPDKISINKKAALNLVKSKGSAVVVLWALLAALPVSIMAGDIPASARPPKGLTIIEPSIELPDVSVSDATGGDVRLKGFTGKVMVINFWATWCTPCIAEMPSLDRLAGLLPQQEFTVLAVSQDEGGAAVVDGFLAAHEIKNLKILYDPSGTASQILGMRGFPTTLVVTPNGFVAGRLEGVTEWDSEDAIGYLQSLKAP